MDDNARAAILAIAEQNDGKVTPDQVVEAARAKRSPLHELFPWDDAAAAHQHRLYLARGLIRAIRVEVTVTPFAAAAPMFVRDPSASPHQGYVMLTDLSNDEERAREVIADEAGRAKAALARARAVAEVLDMEAEADELIRGVTRFRERAQERRSPAEAEAVMPT